MRCSIEIVGQQEHLLGRPRSPTSNGAGLRTVLRTILDGKLDQPRPRATILSSSRNGVVLNHPHYAYWTRWCMDVKSDSL